jgi:hypothetical protein
MSVTTLSVKIAGVEYSAFVADDSTLTQPDKIEERSTCEFTIYDANGAYAFKKGQSVVVTDTLEGIIFSGVVQGIKRTTDVWPHVYHDVSCTDKIAILDAQTSNKVYTNQYAGAIAVDQIKNEWVNGITANFAIDSDSTQADFSAGKLNGTAAMSNVGDGDLELAPAGSVVNILENTTAQFSSGALMENVTASNNALLPVSETALRFVCTQTGVGQNNTYTYVEIFKPGSTLTIASSHYLFYNVWVDPTSPEIKFGVDITFTDNTTLRDDFTVGENSQNNLSPHPATDLSGYADQGKWYGRTFDLTAFAGKNVAYVSIACEGDKPGTYTAWLKDIFYLDSGFSLVQAFFSTSLNVSPPQQLQNQGYESSTVAVVTTYDCTSTARISNAYNISSVGLLKSSFLSWKAQRFDPTTNQYVQINDGTVIIKYSIDGGNSYVVCQNNAPLPILPAGSSLAGTSIQFAEEFSQFPGSNPELPPILTSLQLLLNPSYVASKSDVTYSATVGTIWQNTGTFSNTQTSDVFLQLAGAVSYWDDNETNNDMANMTLMGGAATGPNNVNSCFQFVNKKQLSVSAHQGTEARSRFDFAGQIQNGTLECDIYIDDSLMKIGPFYRTTGTSNYDAQYGYAVEIFGTTVALQRGSNSNTGSAGTRTQVAIATVNFTSQATHHVKVIFSGSSHQIFIDDVRVINATDSTYTAAGYCGFRVSNTDPTNGYISFFDNFGVMLSLTGDWVSNNISLSAAGTYGDSAIYWEDYSLNSQSTNILVQATIDGGATYLTCTNGQPLPNFTFGQSLSGVNLKFTINLATSTASSMPQLRYLIVRVCGQYSSSGTRINKALLLSGVGVCGSTLASWNALTPSGTSVALATSLDGVSYTSVANGGSISGINQQPTPTIDSYNLISSGSYTSTARTGGTATSWIWDTTNSRLTVSGGTNAILLYGAISTKDVDIYFDLDEADNCGVVWRWTSASNYYELLVFDGSSSAGATNIMRLFKVVANVKTQIGSDLPITLKRGDIVKRARVTMIGTAITVYFDGTSLLSTTDSALAGPGQIGFSNVSGVGRLYNLRIQPQGDNLSGKFVYVKQTLTSTDPLLTPQITDLTTLVTNPNIGAGSLIPTANYVNTYKSDNIKDAANQSNYYYNVKHSGEFIFLPRQTIPAPWVLTNKDIEPDSMEVDDSADLYRNRHIMTGVLSTVVVSEIKTGDGSATSWTLEYPVDSMSSIQLNGQTKTFGLKGSTGFDFYYAVGDNSIAQDSSGTVLENVVDQLVIGYVGQTTKTVTRDNTGQFPGTVSQKDYITQSGLSIPVQVILNQASAAVSTSGNSDDLDVSLVKKIAVDCNVTAQSGTSPTVQFFVDRKGADGNYYQIWDSGVISALTTVSVTIGPKCTITEVLGLTVRVRWTIGGSAGPSKTFSISIQGRVDAALAGIGIVEAVEDVSSLLIDEATAEARGDATLQEYGVQGRTFKFITRRTGLAAGQYLSVFLPNMAINDASMLITSIQRNQKFKMTSGSPDQTYFFTIEASDGPVLTSWSNTLNNSLGAK